MSPHLIIAFPPPHLRPCKYIGNPPYLVITCHFVTHLSFSFHGPLKHPQAGPQNPHLWSPGGHLPVPKGRLSFPPVLIRP